ncbi:S9 family peptidase [Shewanella sp. KX20019]|uniref:alpha/beta hydrolase family protein n=1 Tax=Shewanella sp. KX20019 TaxID=2803864 RepID=UPI0019284E3F|nr:alpha/beta fold hydrolase [Shewanella sp. KX20019]QQX81140.1 S9 family peptidase [Shewanella sp. KX20019]
MDKWIKILALLLTLPLPCMAATSTIPVESFSNLRMIESPQVSPNGKSIVAIYNTENGPLVVLSAFGSKEITGLAQLKKAKDRVDFVSWSGNEHVIIGTSYPDYYNGMYFRVSRLYGINVKNKKVRELIHKRMSKESFHVVQSYQLTSTLKHDAEHILVSTYDKRDKAYSVFKVDLTDGSFEKEFANRYEVGAWYPDADGVIRLGIGGEKEKGLFQEKGHFISTWYRTNEDEIFTLLHKKKMGEGATFSVKGLTDDGSKAYVMSDRETGRQSLWLYDIASGKFESKLFGHEKFDLNGTVKNSAGNIVGVAWDDDFERRHYFDEQDSQHFESIKSALKGYEVYIASESKDKTKVLAHAIKDNSPGKYFWIDLSANKGGMWFSQYPHLEKQQLATVQAIQYPASDGVIIPAYLTLPLGLKEGERPALVVLPHGGPHSRSTRYFNPLVQLIVSRGYAVLQMNFRGSKGFGTQFETAGYYQWGKLMQQDVMDGVAWLDTQNIVSKDACIVGASYGGYVALTAAFQDSKRFKCVASIAGISDLKELVEDEERQSTYVDNIVEFDDDAAVDALDEVSAIANISKIKAPILLIHGTRDTRVGYSQSKDFYNKAKSKLDINYIEFENGTHFLDNPDNRKVAYDELSKFLNKHL